MKLFLRFNGKVIKYICYNIKVLIFMVNFKILYIGYLVIRFNFNVWWGKMKIGGLIINVCMILLRENISIFIYLNK